MTETRLSGLLIKTGSIPTNAIQNFSGTVTASLPSGTVSSSAQVTSLLPTGTVSSSAQINTYLDLDGVYSSSTQVVAALPTGTVSASTQYPGWVTASSQIDYGQLQNIPSGIASSSAQVKTYLPTDTVSSSAQVTAFLPIGTVSSSGQVSYLGLSSIPDGIASSSAQIKAYLPTDTVSSSTQVTAFLPAGTVSSSGQVSLSGISGTTFSNNNFTFPLNVTINGVLTAVSQSVQYISSSEVNIGSNDITLNTTEALRFGGIKIFDSGSATNQSGSLFWDSLNNVWLYVHAGTSNTSSILITGPENTGTLGSEQFLSTNRVPKAGVNGDHIIDSQISDDGTTVGIPGSLTVTSSISANRVTASAGFLGTASWASSATYVLPSGLPAGTVSSSGQVSYTGLSSIPVGIVSSSGQVTSLLPTGTVSSSGQVSYTGLSNIPVGIVSSSGQVSYTGLSSIPVGIVSSSGQVTTLLPTGTVSSSAQIPVRTFTVTNSGASAYLIDGASNPTLTLIRGFTYNFSVNASGHPFWIQTVTGSYSSGNIYSTGITNGGAAVGTITFTVPYDAPNTLYYVCQFHSSMAGTINIKDVQPSGLVSSSGQVSYTGLSNTPVGILSSSVTGDAQGQLKINNTNVNVSTLQTTSTPTFAGITINRALETATVSATAATGTIQYNVLTQSVLYYTTNATANWTLNVRGDASTTLNSLMSTGQSLTLVFFVTNGATAYYPTAHQIDGSAVTPKWQGGSAPSAGNVNSIDIYSYSIVKTDNNAYTVFASQTKFA